MSVTETMRQFIRGKIASTEYILNNLMDNGYTEDEVNTYINEFLHELRVELKEVEDEIDHKYKNNSFNGVF